MYILAHQPNVTIQVTGKQIVGQSVVLECKIEAAIDIDSTVDIVWTTGNNVEVRRVKNIPDHSLNNYSDFFSTPLLNDDNRRYQCEVVTNTNPQVKASEIVTLNVTCKFKCDHILQNQSYCHKNFELCTVCT